MGSTYTSLHYHIIFSTKNRRPLIEAKWAARLHEYLGGTIKGHGGITHGVGGMPDHIHLLVTLKATHCLADFMRDLKTAASKWVGSEISQSDFAWQDGYGAFSVSPSALVDVRRYIANQQMHHAHKTFREELIEMLERAGVEYDPKYLD